MFYRALWLATLSLSSAVVAAAAPAATPTSPNSIDPAARLETVTVEASKIPLDAGQLANRVTVIDSERLNAELAQTISDLVRYEPGVDVTGQGGRFGLSGFSIRGIGGNRVQIEVDGVATADAFSIGSFSNAGRDFVDIDSLKQVEVVRGPASAMFGSDALGGVVSFVTRDPSDYLQGRETYFDVGAGFNAVDQSSLLRATAAASFGGMSAVLRVSARDGEQLDTPVADPLEFSSLNTLFKLAFGDARQGAPLLTLENFDSTRDTDVDSQETTQDFSAVFGFPYVVETTDLRGDDRRTRQRVSVSQSWDDGLFGLQYLRWRGYYQASETLQDTFEARTTRIMGMADPVERERRFRFTQDLAGIEINALKSFLTGVAAHDLAFGIELEAADTEQLRDGTQTSLSTGEVTAQVGPDLFPVRDYPMSRTRRAGVYLQDRIEIGELTLIPGLRWDRFSLSPDVDTIFSEDNPGVPSAPLSASRLSPRLGVLWDLTAAWRLYAQYSEGFRAPPVNDVNVGFTNLQFGYTSLPNPDLRAESSAGVELGMRYDTDVVALDAAVFATNYDDFIASFQPVGVDPQSGVLQFQSVNLDDVEIRGAEVQAQWWPAFFPAGLTMRFSAALAQGEDRITGAPLNNIAPLNGVLGFSYSAPSDKWGVNFATRFARRQTDVDQSDGPVLTPAGYVVHDLTGFYQPVPSLRFRAGLFNATDVTYTAYLDVAGLSATLANPERFARPGRQFNVAFDWQF
jgi:hemoglobin/transferrin/lactoferrin receptor protein